MKKKFAGALAVAMMAAAVTGCSGNSGKETTAAVSEAETAASEAETEAAAEEKKDLAGTEITVMVPDWANPGEELLA